MWRTRVYALTRRYFPSPWHNSSRGYGTRRGEGGGVRGMRWFGIPVGLGLVCLAALQLQRTVRRERRRRIGGGGVEGGDDGEQRTQSWQLTAFHLLPARLLSRWWGRVMEKELPFWLRGPLLGTYVWVFGCHMTEAEEEEVGRYKSFSSLFNRKLKAGARPVSSEHPLVCPSDGKVLHLGLVDESGSLEQIKGVPYKLHRFLGQRTLLPDQSSQLLREEEEEEGGVGGKGRELYHVTVYLGPGDYHGFHSPATWVSHTRRHFPGELLTVAPWAVRTMPGLFTLNERVLLLGQWEHGFFSFGAVGAYNVGSISLTMDEELKTNQKGCYVMGQFSDKPLPGGGVAGRRERGMKLVKGQKLGNFQMGSSIVLVFEAPQGFEFCVEPGDSVKYGQPLGQFKPCS